MANLTNRRILVTGGASGIGAASCRLFAAQGAKVAILDRDTAGATRVAKECGGHAFTVDVVDAAALEAAVAAAAVALGGLDSVVNGAGVSIFAPLAETDMAQWDKAMAVNLTAPFLVCRAALPHLQQVTDATIVNISSAVALYPLANRSAYAASKAGLVAFTKVLAMELAPIRVNAICPGAIDTPMVRGTFTNQAQIDTVASRYALKRLGTAEEIAEAVLFLISSASSFVTGTVLAADGGRTYH